MHDLFLEELHLAQFKNYDQAHLRFSEKINCFLGRNGFGKTNLLDAIHYLCACRSYFNPLDSQNIKHQADFFVLEGTFRRLGVEERLYCGLQRNQKKVFRRNKKEYDRLADHLGEFPLVVISPSDRDLISDGSEVRRRFLDGLIGQSNKAYLEDLVQYNKLLQQRNALLKYFAANHRFDGEQLEIFDLQLHDRGMRIHEVRKNTLKDLVPQLQELYSAISGGTEEVGLNYQSQLDEAPLEDLLKANRERDRMVLYTSAGIHKDDLEFLLEGHSMKRYGSQGQQKTYLISLKLAQFELMKQLLGYKPLLLLDDIFDKLDEQRVSALVALVNEHRFGQIFITDTHPERTREVVKRINETSHVFEVIQNGRVDEAAQ